jgi:hypothetical protein
MKASQRRNFEVVYYGNNPASNPPLIENSPLTRRLYFPFDV